MSASRFAAGAGRARPAFEARKIACPSCAGALEIKNEHSRLAICTSCRSHLELSGTEAKVLRKAGDAAPPAGFDLELGDSFKHKKARFEVVGRLRFDEEESDPTRQYLLFNPRRGALWLSEYQGHWDLSRPCRVMPDGEPRALKKGDLLRTHDDRAWVLTGKGTYRLSYVDGALPWSARIGDGVDYAELEAADGSGETYEVEYPLAAGERRQEMEAGRGRWLDLATMRRATGKDLPPPGGARQSALEARRGFRLMTMAAVLAVLVNVVALVYVGVAGERVLDQNLPADLLSGEVLTQPFEVAEDGNVVRFELRAPLDNAWMSVDLGLVTEADGEPRVLHVTDQDLEYYHGVEGGESWSEGSKKKSEYLRVDRAGTYRLLVRAVSGRGEAESTGRSQHPLRVRVIDGAKRPVWVVLALVVSFIALVYIFCRYHGWRSADED